MLKWFGSIFKKKSKWQITNDNPRRYDCRHNSWGHACNVKVESMYYIEEGIDCGQYFKCSGHLSPIVRVGDEVIVTFNRGPAVFTFVEVENMGNVRDMFFATLKVIDYLSNLEKKEITTEYSPESQIAPLRAQGLSESEIERETGLTAPVTTRKIEASGGAS